MGEIIFSICVGGFLVITGVVLIVVLDREEKRCVRDREVKK